MHPKVEILKKAIDSGQRNIEGLVDATTATNLIIAYKKGSAEASTRVSVPFNEMDKFISDAVTLKCDELLTVINNIKLSDAKGLRRLQQLTNVLQNLPEDVKVSHMKDVSVLQDNIHIFDKTGKELCKILINYDDNALSNAVNDR